LNVRFEGQAVAQIRAAHAWWQANRRAAPHLLCPRTRYHVYYLIDEEGGAALILAIWSGKRWRGPSLKRR
jgi:hypothetical protein